MGTLSIGRMTLTVDPDGLEHDGDRGITLTGWILEATMATAKTRRQQLLGLADDIRGESVHRVTWSGDSTLDGFYRLARPPRVSAVEATYQTIYGFKWQLDLERVDGHYSLPFAESFLYGIDRPSPPATTTPWHGIPKTRTSYDVQGAANNSPTVRTGPGGDVIYLPSSLYVSTFARWRLAPANWYDMASTVKINGDEVVGAAVVNAPTSWELSNGYIRAQSVSHASKTFEVVGPAATAGNWGTATGICAGYYGPLGWGKLASASIVAVEVLRNQPWCSAIRLTLLLSYYTNDGIEIYLDLRLRRGAAFVDVALSVAAASSIKWGLELTGNPATTTLTAGGGIIPTANDADGNRWALMTADATDNATAQADLGGSTSWTKGRMYMNTATTKIAYGLGYNRGGTTTDAGGASPAKSTEVRNQWWVGQDEVVKFGVGR
jgi:hypothetical protein